MLAPLRGSIPVQLLELEVGRRERKIGGRQQEKSINDLHNSSSKLCNVKYNTYEYPTLPKH